MSRKKTGNVDAYRRKKARLAELIIILGISSSFMTSFIQQWGSRTLLQDLNLVAVEEGADQRGDLFCMRL